MTLKEFAKLAINKKEEEKEFKSAPSEKSVEDFFVRNPNPKDKKFHAFAARKKVNAHKAEALAYRLATKYTKFKTGGRSNEKGAPKSYDPSQIRAGMKIESEHSSDPDTQKKISKDHIAEYKDYYPALARMERMLKAKKGKGKHGP